MRFRRGRPAGRNPELADSDGLAFSGRFRLSYTKRHQEIPDDATENRSEAIQHHRTSIRLWVQTSLAKISDIVRIVKSKICKIS